MTYGPGGDGAFATYGYNARNQLISFSGAGGWAYDYDPAGQRVALTSGTDVTRFVINPIVENSGTASSAF